MNKKISEVFLRVGTPIVTSSVGLGTAIGTIGIFGTPIGWAAAPLLVGGTAIGGIFGFVLGDTLNDIVKAKEEVKKEARKYKGILYGLSFLFAGLGTLGVGFFADSLNQNSNVATLTKYGLFAVGSISASIGMELIGTAACCEEYEKPVKKNK